jgi:hypothetical protein
MGAFLKVFHASGSCPVTIIALFSAATFFNLATELAESTEEHTKPGNSNDP